MMKRKPTLLDLLLLVEVRNRLTGELRRFNPPRTVDDANPDNAPVFECRHDVPWTECTKCSTKVRR